MTIAKRNVCGHHPHLGLRCGQFAGIAGVFRSENYSVLEASTGPQAPEKGKTCGPISVLVTDVDSDSSGTDSYPEARWLVSEPDSSVHFWNVKVLVDRPRRVQLQTILGEQCRFYRKAVFRVRVAREDSELAWTDPIHHVEMACGLI